eukprot:c25305_g1_i1.p1 GENE.c25305_g1_i1~~c25305_g1_i1.p1  ORF type:complete len:471 (-),score=82.34 c25305_g1_i1:57-1469(-)
MGLITENNYYYLNGNWNTTAPRASRNMIVQTRVTKPFHDLWKYYANLIDFGRIFLSILSLLVMMYADTYRYTIAWLIMANVLLDWVDGPVARAYGQSSILGCGLDWCADILAQYCIAIWICRPGAEDLPHWFVTFTVLFTCVEIVTGVFDFAISATATYPKMDKTASLPWYFSVEHLLVPDGSYNHLGTVGWLANTMCPLSFCLHLPNYVSYTLLPFALLYAWHECVQLVFVLANWQERTAQPAPGVDFLRMCTSVERKLLDDSFREATTQIAALKSQVSASPMGSPTGTVNAPINWFNFYCNGSWHDERGKVLQPFVDSLLREFYDTPRVILSFGFIISHANVPNALPQAWHYDYGPNVSNLFVPLSRITHRNATQYVRGRRPEPLPPSQYYDDPDSLLDAEGLDYVEMCQSITRPYAILRLFESVMHRGISNGEAEDRVLFFISTNDTFLDIGEAAVMTAEAEGYVDK